jgi:cysteine-rich repeat protein
MKKLSWISSLIAMTLAVAIPTWAGALPVTPSPTLAGWPTCPEIQYDEAGNFVYGDHASHHNPGDAHGIIGGKLPDGTLLPNRNLVGLDDVYVVSSRCLRQRFVQCYCSKGDPDLPDGVGIQTLWRVADSCSEATGNEVCAPFGCNWNIPYYSGGHDCKPAIAFHSNFYDCLPHVCGNGIVDAGEECDDGNNVNGDGCDVSCKKECGPIEKDPGTIKFVPGKPDQFRMHGRISLETIVSPVRVRILNDTKTAYDASFPIIKGKSRWEVKGEGFYFRIGGKKGVVRFNLFDKRSELGVFSPTMSIRVDVGGKCFRHLPAWKPNKHWWRYNK